MSENTMPEQNEVAPNAKPEPGSSEPSAEGAPALQKMVNPEQLAEIRERLKKFASGEGKTISGSEAPDDAQPRAAVSGGKDVDWSEYDLEFSVRHLYPQATFRETPQGPKWVAMVDEFFSTEREWRGHGKRVNVPGGVDKTETDALNLGEYLNDMLNSAEGWKLISLLPGSSGRAGLLLRRAVPVILPDPKPLKKETEVEAPSDPELQQVEDAALAFATREGLAPPAGEPDQPQRGALEQLALALNPPTERTPLPLDAGRPQSPPVREDLAEQAGKEAEVAVTFREDFEKKVDDEGHVKND